MFPLFFLPRIVIIDDDDEDLEMVAEAILDEETNLLLDQKLYEPNIEQICKKTKGLSKIDSRSQKQAIKLVYWRESIAQKENKPRKWIMSDEKLLDYACGKNNLSVSSKKLFDKFTSQNFKKSTF